MVRDVKDGGVFLINCQWSDEELDHHMPAVAKRYIAEHNIQVYTINAIDLAIEIGMGKRTNTILQSAFFKLAKVMPEAEAIGYMKDAATHSYLKKGQDVVDMNHKAIDMGATAFHKFEVPASWKDAKDETVAEHVEGNAATVKMVKEIMEPVGRMDGDSLPVSAFANGHEDGTFCQGASAYEKRGVAVSVPEWDQTKCIQCNQCSYVCPHATIRPYALTEEEAKNAPCSGQDRGHQGRQGQGCIQVCHCHFPCWTAWAASVCVSTCPVKALTMKPQESQAAEQEVFDYMGPRWPPRPTWRTPIPSRAASSSSPSWSSPAPAPAAPRPPMPAWSPRSAATVCIFPTPPAVPPSGAARLPPLPTPSTRRARVPPGPTPLFEDNAEHGLGLHLGQKAIRSRLADKTRALLESNACAELKDAAQKWLDTMEDGAANAEATKNYIAALEDGLVTVDELAAFAASDAGKQLFGDKQGEVVSHAQALKAEGKPYCDCPACKLAAEILKDKEYLVKKSVWIFGGDGWAYDIGYGGLDHVIASGEDVNIFVFDTEVYSNTGGQASKSSNIGQVAQFAAAGKNQPKKSLAEIAMQYGYVYVAQVAMGANPNQTLKAITEAEAYHGPSLVIGYAPCEMHSIKGGMANCQVEMKKAVECGYWNLFRFNPALKAEGKNPFTLDSKAPAGGYQEFLMNEARYSSPDPRLPRARQGAVCPERRGRQGAL